MGNEKMQTIMAFVRLLCPLIASGVAVAGYSLDANAIFVGVVILIALVTFIWSWWKNNNVTKAAKEAQEVLDFIKHDGNEMLDETEDELSNGKGADEDEQQ